jgi:multiple sugar transport system substrate-binding protein
MKRLFLALFIVAAALYAGAQWTLPRPRRDVVTLRWATDPNPARKVQTELFAKLNPGYQVTVESAAMEKLLVQCATGTGPDIVDHVSVEVMQQFVDAGLLLDLTPHAEPMGFGPKATFAPVKLGLYGKQYRFPCNVWANCIVFNKELFDQRGVAYPTNGWTWTDLGDIARKLNKGRELKDHCIPLATLANHFTWADIYFGCGGTFYSADGLRSQLDSPAALEATKIYHDLMHVQRAIPTPDVANALSSQGGWGLSGIHWFSNGKAGMLIIGRWYLNMLVNYPGMAEKLGAVTLPRVPPRESGGWLRIRASAINARTPHQEGALRFLAFLASREYNELIVRDGDSIPPNPVYSRTGADLVNPTIQDPAWHQPFIDAVQQARPVDTSPFMDPTVAERWLKERLDRIDNNPKADVAAVMQDLAREINERIQLNLKRSAALRTRYAAVTGHPFREATEKREQP